MLFDKQTIIDYISRYVGPDQAQQAARMLPDQVDDEQLRDMLTQYGVDPDRMMDQLGQRLADQATGFAAYEDEGQQRGYDDELQRNGYGGDEDGRGGPDGEDGRGA
ncbi:MAG: hypothetical protein E6J41_18420 [Chloroflexi bacterium]|nr:MAG: hypothetical protein E6J41_18420 [Chloroflexota bacterium]